MTLPDLVNGSYETLGSVAVLLSCLRLYKAKRYQGIDPVTVLFFTSWGMWNLYYYPHLGQTMSGIAAGCVCASNCFWLFLLFIYRNNR